MWESFVEKVLDLAPLLPRFLVRVFNISIISVALCACGSHSYQAPVTDMEPPPSRKVKTHTVAAGETLYSIAWRYDLDFQDLAQANSVGNDFKIYPGQTLNLNVEPRKPWAERQRQARSKLTETRPATRKVTSPPTRSINTTNTTKPEAKEVKSVQPLGWRWPLEGKVITNFRAKKGLQKGIDIRGKLGEAVVAASAGVVVYSGDGLRGYGKLLIVKHNDTYLSAYAHNRRLLVKEGDQVQAGEKIAEVGSTGTDSVKLYFEIRRDGKPVNPLLYLPKS